MAFPLQTDSITEVRIKTLCFGQTCLNVLHYQYTGTSVADYVDGVNELLDGLQVNLGLVAKMRVILSTQHTQDSIDGQPVFPLRLASVTQLIDAAGLNGGTPLPQNIAAVVEKRTPVARRFGIGSMHLAGLTVDLTSKGQFTAGALTQLGDIGTKMVAPVTVSTGSFKPVLWNVKVFARATAITGFKAQRTVRVMRRRTVGVGI